MPHKYAALTALAIALNITMLALAATASLTPANANSPVAPSNEADCDAWAHGWRKYAIGCHCQSQCTRQYNYTVTVRCWPWQAAYWQQRGRHEGLCDVTRVSFEPYRACFAKCVASAK
jgi:hypothetical protein